MTDEEEECEPLPEFAIADVLDATRLEEGVGLSLSGGGFRAMLFHLGSLIRLNEVGLLAKVDRVSSVSGGSLAAGILAAGWHALQFDPNGVALNFDQAVSVPLLRLARRRVDAPAILFGLLPFVHASNVAARIYDKRVFNGKTLQDLPERPRFIFTSTSLQTGVLWRFAREYSADWRVGKWTAPNLPLTLAVAASAGFPPLLSPAVIKPPKDGIVPWKERTTAAGSAFTKRLFLTDGGVYDNLGLEPIWKRYRTLLVSDGGAVTQPIGRPFTNWYSQFRRVLDVSLQQGINTRVRILHGLERTQARKVAYWGISTPVTSYGPSPPVAFPEESTRRASLVPTRLTRFSDDIRRLLVEAGYAHTTAALAASRIALPLPSPADLRRLPAV
ncbi:patatin-like phospholipase family protein [Bradyrhizobium yuanmingense]|uniref:patatin-like phospholipase family protein n=1 Tax=Bradyrhizobium yuanmingense TaxID=108015 RepID=UPI0006841D9C|nr:patatin-like phospholipase family protein [Bradyrhizobium yuanmingense]